MEIQVCPAFKNLPHAIRLAASLRSAVSSIIQGLFPPSSSEIGVRFSLALFHYLFAHSRTSGEKNIVIFLIKNRIVIYICVRAVYIAIVECTVNNVLN